MIGLAEYIWLDGSRSRQLLRSKTRYFEVPSQDWHVFDFPQWTFDGSMTNQADPADSDCTLDPVRVVLNPLGQTHDMIVLNEVQGPDGKEHPSNARAALRRALKGQVTDAVSWFGFEQQYRLVYPRQASQKLLASGQDNADFAMGYTTGLADTLAAEIAEEHARACVRAGLLFHGFNAGGSDHCWAFRIGVRDMDADLARPLRVADDLWIARHLLDRIAMKHGMQLAPPDDGLAGGAQPLNLHTNFSTARSRSSGGLGELYRIIKRLARREDNDLVSLSSTTPFTAGGADRNASIRIPLKVQQAGCGYLQDRRPGAAACPYTIAALLVCGAIEQRGDERQRRQMI